MAKINIKLNKQQQQMLVAGILLLGGFGTSYVALFWMPVSQKIAAAQKEIEEVDAKIEKATRQAARLPRLEQYLVQLNQQAVDAERRLPKKKSTTDILVTVTELADKNHIILLSFGTGGTAGKNVSFTELNYPITVKGSFHNIGKFLASIALEERIFNVSNVVYGAASDAGDMSVTFTLVSYQYKG